METRIRPHLEQKAVEQQRAAQTRQFARNQVLGLVLLAMAVFIWWLLRGNRQWLFPPGWWRL